MGKTGKMHKQYEQKCIALVEAANKLLKPYGFELRIWYTDLLYKPYSVGISTCDLHRCNSRNVCQVSCHGATREELFKSLLDKFGSSERWVVGFIGERNEAEVSCIERRRLEQCQLQIPGARCVEEFIVKADLNGVINESLV